MHICYVDSGGEVWCWGNNSNGQFALGGNASRTTPNSTIAGAVFWRP